MHILTKVLMTLSLKFILSVWLVKNRGTYEGGEGQPAAFISAEHGVPLSILMVGRPERDKQQLLRKCPGAQTLGEHKEGQTHLISELPVSLLVPWGRSRRHQTSMIINKSHEIITFYYLLVCFLLWMLPHPR